MQFVNHYEKWGFEVNPFTTLPLTYDEKGIKLCVGRENELQGIIRRLISPPNAVTLEGPNGIGKTSLINVASYSLLKNFLENNSNKLYILCLHSFQLRIDYNIEEFIDVIFLKIAETIINNEATIRSLDISLNGLDEIINFIQTYQLSTFQGGIAAISFGESVELNSSITFKRGGFRSKIIEWLNEFRKDDKCSIIAVIDNLELVGSSSNAKQLLEELRDTVLNLPSVRWVLSGAQQIVLGAASSPRLDGVFHQPIEIVGIKQESAKEIYQRRVENCRIKDNAFLPISAKDFERLLVIFGGNLRYCLSYADQYCTWFADNTDTEEVLPEFYIYKWIERSGDQLHSAFIKRCKPRAVELFAQLGEEVFFSYQDAEKFGFKSYQNMSQYVSQIEEVGLVQSIRDDRDKRRKSFYLTAKGMILGYQKYNFYRRSESDIDDPLKSTDITKVNTVNKKTGQIERHRQKARSKRRRRKIK